MYELYEPGESVFATYGNATESFPDSHDPPYGCNYFKNNNFEEVRAPRSTFVIDLFELYTKIALGQVREKIS